MLGNCISIDMRLHLIRHIKVQNWNMTYSDNNDFLNHITIMCNKWTCANALGTVISNVSLKTIVLNSLPQFWDPTVAILYGNMSSTLHEVSPLSKFLISSAKTRANSFITTPTVTIANILLIFVIGLEMVKKANFHQVLEREKIQRKAQQILDKISLKNITG